MRGVRRIRARIRRNRTGITGTKRPRRIRTRKTTRRK